MEEVIPCEVKVREFQGYEDLFLSLLREGRIQAKGRSIFSSRAISLERMSRILPSFQTQHMSRRTVVVSFEGFSKSLSAANGLTSVQF